MNEELDNNDVKSTLIAFMSSMKDWESEFFEVWKDNLSKGIDGRDLYTDYVDWLEEILGRFSVKGKLNWDRLVDLGCTKPVTYDPDVDSVSFVYQSEKKAILEVKPGCEYNNDSRFSMIKKDGSWKIGKMEILTVDGKWQRSAL
ncbi:NTF2 fold immunity protein [Pseudomonas alabamensis]|uniref:NTF2 fold immunity protein n=1 Tax=Pseudomonas alabamensis TaxID=3064349 RepID=UPI0011A5D9AB